MRQAKYYLPRLLQHPRVMRLIYCGCRILFIPRVLRLVYCGCRILFIPRVLRLVYCGSYIFDGSNATVHEPQYTRDKKYLVYCSTSCTAAAAVVIDVPQFESFYTVPEKAGNGLQLKMLLDRTVGVQIP